MSPTRHGVEGKFLIVLFVWIRVHSWLNFLCHRTAKVLLLLQFQAAAWEGLDVKLDVYVEAGFAITETNGRFPAVEAAA